MGSAATATATCKVKIRCAITTQRARSGTGDRDGPGNRARFGRSGHTTRCPSNSPAAVVAAVPGGAARGGAKAGPGPALCSKILCQTQCRLRPPCRTAQKTAPPRPSSFSAAPPSTPASMPRIRNVSSTSENKATYPASPAGRAISSSSPNSSPRECHADLLREDRRIRHQAASCSITPALLEEVSGTLPRSSTNLNSSPLHPHHADDLHRNSAAGSMKMAAAPTTGKPARCSSPAARSSLVLERSQLAPKNSAARRPLHHRFPPRLCHGAQEVDGRRRRQDLGSNLIRWR